MLIDAERALETLPDLLQNVPPVERQKGWLFVVELLEVAMGAGYKEAPSFERIAELFGANKTAQETMMSTVNLQADITPLPTTVAATVTAPVAGVARSRNIKKTRSV